MQRTGIQEERVADMEKRHLKAGVFYAWYLRRRVFAFLIFLVFVLIFGISSILGIQHYRGRVAHITASNQTTANLLALVIAEHQKKMVSLLQSYASRRLLVAALKNRDPDRAMGHLIRLKSENPEVESLTITNRQGNLWLNYPVNREVRGRNFASREWYQGVSKSWKPYVSGAFRRVVAEKDLSIVVSVPIFDEKGRAIHILSSIQRLSMLAEIINRFPFESYEHITLIDRSGNMLYSNIYPYQADLTRYPYLSAVTETLPHGKKKNSILTIREGRDKRYLSPARVEGSSWALIVETSGWEVLNEEQGYILGIAVISLLTFLLIAAFLFYTRKDILYWKMAELLAAENTAREKERRYSSLLESIHMIAVGLDPEGRITYANPYLLELTGFTADEVLGKNWFDLFLPERGKTGAQETFKSLQGDTSVSYYENPILTKPGQERLIAWNNTILKDDQGQFSGTMSLGVDITERTRAEEKIRNLNEDLERRVAERTAEIEAANRELEAFSYSVSHDLRAPLRSINGFSQAIEEDCRDVLDETGKSHLNRVRKATQHMGFLIDDMLKLARLTKAEMQNERVDLSKIAKDVIQSLQQADPKRRVEVLVREEVTVRGDPYLMRIVMENLLDNAWKFTGKNPQARIEFGVRERDGENCCFVRDNGVGFDMAYTDKLFGAFQRLHRQDEFPGTGIGLATVQRIINRHRGRIWTEARAGEGATFFFVLPSPP
jgi:PAS domain S-box-containing protein